MIITLYFHRIVAIYMYLAQRSYLLIPSLIEETILLDLNDLNPQLDCPVYGVGCFCFLFAFVLRYLSLKIIGKNVTCDMFI